MRLQAFVTTRRLFSSRRPSNRFPLLATALEAFYKQYNHFVVPYHFQVPPEDPFKASDSFVWPEDTRGFHLGRQIRKFVGISSREEESTDLMAVREQLDAVGFPAIRDWRRFQWEQVSLSALTRYKEIEGNLLVPRKFVVPTGDPQWPRATWGLRLGSHVNYLRRRRDTMTMYQIQDLDKIEFVWVVADYAWNVLFMPALRQFRQLYGHCDVPQNYVAGVSSDSGTEGWHSWAKELTGYRLGATVNRIRSNSAFLHFMERDKNELEQLGFYLNSHDRTWTETILPAFKTYFCIYGNCDIDTSFIVPEEESWPPSAWNLRLGFIVRNIRNRGDYFLQIAQDLGALEEIGFVWNVAAAKWEHAVLPALHT
uniref:Helicase-associated domain-containing protein n=1 Tax=Peronospora matthiolae TaxID=2874970 RepID=A0AAV1USC8_9STRA